MVKLYEYTTVTILSRDATLLYQRARGPESLTQLSAFAEYWAGVFVTPSILLATEVTREHASVWVTVLHAAVVNRPIACLRLVSLSRCRVYLSAPSGCKWLRISAGVCLS